ncbi:MAG: hypothetical protein KatS3mg082_1995 [Nitrospiraceae bacterium]|nr:MAG: hypothetical protein KatS3mg082_1995 [Nitrospiraceae bacterium]
MLPVLIFYGKPLDLRCGKERRHSDRSAGSRSVPAIYQFVPLLMALRLDPVRLLIADDVGVGKTIEALLVARELLDRGEIKRMLRALPTIPLRAMAEGAVREIQSGCGRDPVGNGGAA